MILINRFSLSLWEILNCIGKDILNDSTGMKLTSVQRLKSNVILGGGVRGVESFNGKKNLSVIIYL